MNPQKRRLSTDDSAAIGSGGFIIAVITIVIALALLPVVLNFVQSDALLGCHNTSTGDGIDCSDTESTTKQNLSSTQLTLLDLTPTFYLIGVFVGLIAWLAITRRTG